MNAAQWWLVAGVLATGCAKKGETDKDGPLVSVEVRQGEVKGSVDERGNWHVSAPMTIGNSFEQPIKVERVVYTVFVGGKDLEQSGNITEPMQIAGKGKSDVILYAYDSGEAPYPHNQARFSGEIVWVGPGGKANVRRFDETVALTLPPVRSAVVDE